MSDIVERLRGTGAERQRTTAHDTPGHYLHVVAKISNADGRLMDEAADEITRLRNELHIAQEWSARVIDGQEQDMNEITALRAEVEKLRAALAFTPTHRHLKRGSTYQVIGEAALQTSREIYDYEPLTIYRAEDGTMWARPTDEFRDGRFEALGGTP